MFIKNIFIFLILSLLTLAKIYGAVAGKHTDECNLIYGYLESQGKAENIYDCIINNKGKVTELYLSNEMDIDVFSVIPNTVEILSIGDENSENSDLTQEIID